MSTRGGKDLDDRTALAEDRSILSVERTFAAWLRTGLAALAVGIAFERLFLEAQPTWVPKAGASLLLTLSAALFVFSFWRYRRSTRNFDRHSLPRLHATAPALMTALATLAAAAAGLVIWII